MRPAALATLIKTAKISIHAPLAGCDKTHPPCAKACRYFNPRTPCGVRRVVLRNTITKIDISIHAPLAGCDPCSGISFRAAHDFNPRTPCGVRLRVGLFLDGKLDFNPRTPCGVRPASISRVSGVQVFQSTHPLRGATAKTYKENCTFFELADKLSARIAAKKPSARADRCLCRYCAASVETADASFYCRRNFRLHVPGSAGISRSVTVQNHDFPCRGNHIPSQGRSFSKTQKSLLFLAIDLFLKEKCSLFRS